MMRILQMGEGRERGGGRRNKGKLRTAFWSIFCAEQNVIYAFLKYLFISITTSVLIIRISFFFRTVRSLWHDEAWVAVSIISSNLFASQAQWNKYHQQLAGILYLNTVKLFGMIFGYGEHILRFFSLLAFLGMLFLVWKLLRKVFNIEAIFAWAGVSMASVLPTYIYYSNELKPYMGDVFFILLVLWVYHLFSIGKIKVFWLGIIYSVILLFSIPSSFFIAGVFIVEFIDALKSKDKKRILELSLSGFLVLTVFIAHYYFWLSYSSESKGLKGYWKLNTFNMWPTSIKEIHNDYKLITGLFHKSVFPFSFSLSCLMAFCGLILAIFKKHKPSIAVGLSIVLLLTASSFGKYPIAQRLNLFVYALTIVYMLVFLDRCKFMLIIESLSKSLITRINAKHLALIFIAFSLWMGRDYIDYTGKGLYKVSIQRTGLQNLRENIDYTSENLYRVIGGDANELIKYVQDNIKEDEFLYINNMGKFALEYKNGIGNKTIGKTGKDNIIFGKGSWRKSERNLKEKIEFGKIVSAKKCYVLIYHNTLNEYRDYLKRLSAFGDLKLVMNVHETRLYYFTAKNK